MSFDPNGTSRWQKEGVSFICPYPSAIGWVILIQYLLLVKLFLTTLLTAMFSHTKAKVDAESDQIVIIFYQFLFYLFIFFFVLVDVSTL